ncbi:MAG: membrane protein insertion efficiency factor YidD [Polyangiaceae bacterium]
MSASTLPVSATGDGRLAASDLARFLPLVPRNAALSLLHGYRATISHTYGDVCKYYPSCSAYAVGAVQQHGAVKGSALAAARIARCHPWAKGGIDDVPPHKDFRYELTPRGFVVPVPLGKD